MKKKIVITLILSILLMLIGGLAYAYNTPENKLKRQLELGNKYLNEQNYEEAILSYIKAIEVEPKNVEARLNLSESYLATKKFDEAEKTLLKVLEIDSKNIDAREYLIKIYLSQNKIAEAEKILQEIFEIDPNKDEQFIREDINLAKEIETSKQDYNTGIKLMSNKKYIEAIDSFKKVVEADKESYSDSQNKITECKNSYINENLQKAKNQAQNKNYKDAISYLDLVLQIDSSNSEANKLNIEYEDSLKKEQEDKLKNQQVNKLLTSEEAVAIMNNLGITGINAYGPHVISSDKFIIESDNIYGHQGYSIIGIGGNATLFVVDANTKKVYEAFRGEDRRIILEPAKAFYQ